MKLYELTMALCAMLEVLNPEFVRRARESWNPGHGSLDGAIAGQMLDHIKKILPYIDDNLKRDAYNEIADAEKLGRIDEDEVNLDLSINEALLDPVIDMLIDAENGDNLARKGPIH